MNCVTGVIILQLIVCSVAIFVMPYLTLEVLKSPILVEPPCGVFVQDSLAGTLTAKIILM